MNPVDRILTALRERGYEPKRSGKGWQVRCPAHDDRNPSLSIDAGDDGRVLVNCHAGCTIDAVCRALAIAQADLFPDRMNGNTHAMHTHKKARTYPTLDAAIASAARLTGGEHAGTWNYRTGDGADAFHVFRFNLADGSKQFRPVHHNGAGFVLGDPPGMLPLYRLPDLQGASRVWITEGEKAADAARSIGLTATTSAHGSKSASKTDWRPLAGKEVLILPDGDEAGEHYAASVAAILHGLGCKVRIVRLPDLPVGGDIFDWIEARECVESETIRAGIEALAEAAPVWQPENAGNPLDPERARIELRIVKASELGNGDKADWVWHGYIARGFITLLVGLWKGGKSTLLGYLVKAIAAGGGDIGGAIVPGKVLVVSEEGAGLWARRRDDIGIGDDVHFIIRPFKGRPARSDWESFVKALAERVNAEGYAAIIFDTLSAVNPVADENDAAAMMAALTPLHHLTEAGAAVLIIHHPRKGDGNEGQASRGSGALPGFVDIILELRRFEPENAQDRRRVLTAYSRFDETPSEVVLELGDEGYAVVGTKADAKRTDRQAIIASLLAANLEGSTIDGLREQWPVDGVPKPSRRTLANDLDIGFNDGQWLRIGEGVKGDPYRYKAKPQFDSGTVNPLDARIEYQANSGDAA